MPSFRHWPIWATCSSFFSRDIKNCLWRNRVPMMMISVVEQIIMMVIMVLMMTKITNKHTNIITFWRKLLFLATFTLSGIFSPEMFNPMRHGNTVFWLLWQEVQQCLQNSPNQGKTRAAWINISDYNSIFSCSNTGDQRWTPLHSSSTWAFHPPPIPFAFSHSPHSSVFLFPSRALVVAIVLFLTILNTVLSRNAKIRHFRRKNLDSSLISFQHYFWEKNTLFTKNWH